jgi:3-deoxy-7-phosphoheptulonate synthase
LPTPTRSAPEQQSRADFAPHRFAYNGAKREERPRMLIVLDRNATPEQVDAVCALVREHGGTPRRIEHPHPAIAISGAAPSLSADHVRRLEGVDECVVNGDLPRLGRRSTRPEGTVVSVRGERIGGGLALIAGPCAIESRDQALRTAELISGLGVRFFRGGAYKPRTSPYAFQGLRDEGLRILETIRDQFDLRLVSEVLDAQTLDRVTAVADIVQIGSRNMHNYALLEAAARISKPVLLKRGFCATVHEWLHAAEYLLAGGNAEVILCERGIRTFETATRNTLDLGGAVMARQWSHLPVIVDPSHGVGVASAVPALACAAAASGLDGVMLEVHPEPIDALSDGQQALDPTAFRELMPRLTEIARLARPL